jgi:hypothetical protein
MDPISNKINFSYPHMGTRLNPKALRIALRGL